MTGQGFSVDTDKLLDVATSVARLKEDLAGSSVAGSLPNYQSKADASVLRSALASFWDGEDVFATAYETEHNGIVTTMQSMLTQLDALERACRTTASQYGTHETETTSTVTKSGGEGWQK